MYHTDGSVAMTKEGSEADHNTGQANYMEKKALPRQRTEGLSSFDPMDYETGSPVHGSTGVN